MNETMLEVETERRGPSWLSWLVCMVLTGLSLYWRLVLYRDRMVPMADAVALLACLWVGSRRLLWGMALVFTVALVYKVLWILPAEHKNELREWAYICILLLNMWIVAIIVHCLLGARHRLEEKHAALQRTNGELTASNEELAAREEEVSRQNEELQSQTEELEQQGEELQLLNQEVGRREKALQTLLETSRWLRSDVPEAEVTNRICKAAAEVMEGHACAAAVVLADGGQVAVRGHYGFGAEGPVRGNWGFERSFTALAMKQERTAYLSDVALRPDLEIPQRANGVELRSVLASPLRVEGEVVGALEVYSEERCEWTEENFRVMEWLAVQSSLVLESASLQRELEEKRREAEEASVRKTRFLAAVSHDVRTPAYAINLMAELIGRAANDAALSKQLPQLAGDLRANAMSLVALVSDVLDLARFDSGKLDLQESEFAMCSMVEAEVRQLLPLAQSKGLQLTVTTGDGVVWLHADRMKLARVVGNLIGNAIKFTERGSVQVLCGRLADGRAEVRVADTGVGIPEEQLPNIFDEFYQLRNPERDGAKGTGLGLAICKRLLDVMKCELVVESEVGRGSTFAVRIPASLVIDRPGQTAGAEKGQAAEAMGGKLGGVQVLLVEDHEMTRRATAQLLAAEGATVIQASNGREAVRLLAHEYPQVLLLDLMLPDMDGTEVLRRVRERRPESLRCVLVVSGDVTEARKADVKQLGADGLLAKPLDIGELIGAIRAALEESVAAGPSAAAG